MTAAARVAVVTGADTTESRARAEAIAPVVDAIVLCGVDQHALGVLAGELDGEVRVAVFVGEPTDDDDRRALGEMLDELFGDRR